MILRMKRGGFRAFHTRTLGEDHCSSLLAQRPTAHPVYLSECSSRVIRQMHLKATTYRIVLGLAKVKKKKKVLC